MKMNPGMGISMMASLALLYDGFPTGIGYRPDTRNPLFYPDAERAEKIKAESRADQSAKEARRAARFK